MGGKIDDTILLVFVSYPNKLIVPETDLRLRLLIIDMKLMIFHNIEPVYYTERYYIIEFIIKYII